MLKKNKNLETENESIQHENVLLRQESQKVLEDNREYQDIIAQLSIYARQLKKVKGKMTELEEIITVYEEDIHQRIHNISETNAYDKEKKEYPINQKKF